MREGARAPLGPPSAPPLVTKEVDPEAVDPTAPLDGLLLNFRYRFFNDQYCHVTSWYNLEFSGRITEHIHRGALSAFLDARSVPLAARDDALRHIFNMYGGFGLIESIQATVRIYAYNYMPFNHIFNVYGGFGLVDEDVFLGLDEGDSDRAMEMSDEDFLGPTPASSEVVDALEKVKVRADVAETRETRCAVCLEGFRVGFEVTTMPCSHTFHGNCIVRWLEHRNFCPLCRFELPSQ